MADMDRTIGFDAGSLAKIRLIPSIFESPKLTQAVKKILVAVMRQAKLARIIDTGRLMSSITSGEVKRSPGEISGNVDTGKTVNQVAKSRVTGRMVRLTGTNVKYAKYVEYGTDRMPARPFMQNALNYVESREAMPILKQAVNEAWSNICAGRKP